jgi:predicted nucleic acid-binding protein
MVQPGEVMEKKRETNAQDADELYAHRHDPDEWEDEAEPIVVRPSRTSVVSVRIPTEDLDAIEQAAAQTHQTISEYIRAAIAAQLRAIAPPSATFSITYSSTHQQGNIWRTWNTAESSLGANENQPPVQAVNTSSDA